MIRALCLPLLALAAACAHPQPSAPPPVLTSAPTPPPPARGVGAVHRFDFALASNDSRIAPVAFSLVLEEGRPGEVMLGKNVALVSPSNASSQRTDVGLKVRAEHRAVGEGVFLNVMLELSGLDDAAMVRKLVSSGGVLAVNGKRATVITLDDDQKHYELIVLPTKLR